MKMSYKKVMFFVFLYVKNNMYKLKIYVFEQTT